MRKSVEFKENGDWVAHMYYNKIVSMFFFFEMRILLYEKSIFF